MASEVRGATGGSLKGAPVGSRVACIFYRRWLKALIIFAIVVISAEVLLTRFFPFSEKNVTESLVETFPSNLTINHFRPVYFPRPGCEADGVTFSSKSASPGQPPVVTIQKLITQGNYANFVFRPHHVSRVILESLRIQVPPLEKAENLWAATPIRKRQSESWSPMQRCWKSPAKAKNRPCV